MEKSPVITARTLLQIKRQFPAHSWSDREVRKLLDAEHGVITGFQGILDDLDKLMREDLGTTPPMTSGRPSSVSKVR